MEWSDRPEFDDDSESTFSPGDLGLPPPHLRAWRHPSELVGVSAPSASRSKPSRGHRRLFGGVAFGVVCVAGYSFATSASPNGSRPSRVGLPTTTLTLARAAAGAGLATPTHPTVTSAVPTSPSVPARVVPTALVVDDQGLLVGLMPVTADSAEFQVVLPDGSTTWAVALRHDATTGLTVLRTSTPTTPTVRALCLGVVSGDAVQVQGGGQSLDGRIDQTLAEVELDDGTRVGPAMRIELRTPVDRSTAPLVYANGVVIGVVVAADRTGVYAIPAELAAGVARSMARGTKAGAWMGISGETTTANEPVITDVDPRSPAAAALVQGDVIESVDGIHVVSMWGVSVATKSREPGTVVQLGIRRGAEHITKSVTLGERPALPA